jgi:rSAM/selenodomain-associated transferase 2
MKISVIIPALNEEAGIISSLQSVTNQPGDIEVIVVDGGSTDRTRQVAQPYARVIQSEQGRGAQMNVGAQESRGEVLLFLHADSQLPPDALPQLKRVLGDPQTIGGTFMLRFDSPKFLLRLIAFFTRFRFRYFHYGDQGIFVRRAVFEQMGGFKRIPLMEDLDFFQRLHKVGRVVLLKQPVTTSARRFLKNGILQQQLLNVFLVFLYLLEVKSETLLKWYR